MLNELRVMIRNGFNWHRIYSRGSMLWTLYRTCVSDKKVADFLSSWGLRRFTLATPCGSNPSSFTSFSHTFCDPSDISVTILDPPCWCFRYWDVEKSHMWPALSLLFYDTKHTARDGERQASSETDPSCWRSEALSRRDEMAISGVPTSASSHESEVRDSILGLNCLKARW
jgi:hypothetical protein